MHRSCKINLRFTRGCIESNGDLCERVVEIADSVDRRPGVEILADSTTQSGLVEDERLRSQIVDRVGSCQGQRWRLEMENTDRRSSRRASTTGAEIGDRDWRLEIAAGGGRGQMGDWRSEIGDVRCE